jgi:hypothetical protein
MTPFFCCGFECGAGPTTGVHATTTGTGGYANDLTISTSIVRSGLRAARLNPNNAIVRWGTFCPSGVRDCALRFYRRFDAHPTSDVVVGGFADLSSNVSYGLTYNSADGKYYAGKTTGSSGLSIVTGSTGITIPTGSVFRLIEIRVNTTSNPAVIDVSVDGQRLGTATFAIAASDLQRVFGGSTHTAAFDFYDDDVVATTVGADHPIGDGYVLAFVTTSDGTHNVAGTGDFQRGNTAVDILNATTTAYQLIDDVPIPTGTVNEADNWRAVAPPNSTDYVESIFGPVSGTAPNTAPRAVEVAIAHHQISTQSGNIRVALNDNGTVNDVMNLTGAGVVTYRYISKHYATAPTGGAWTVQSGAGNFNNIRNRFYSSDAAPDQCLDAIMIEAEFPGSEIFRPLWRRKPFTVRI